LKLEEEGALNLEEEKLKEEALKLEAEKLKAIKLKAINNINSYIKVNNQMTGESGNYMEMTWKGMFPKAYTRNLNIRVEIPTPQDFEDALRVGGGGEGAGREGNMEDFLYCSYYDSSRVKKGHSVLIGKDDPWPFLFTPEVINEDFTAKPASADGRGGGRKKTKRRKSKKRKSKRKTKN